MGNAWVEFIRIDGNKEEYAFRNLEEALEYVSYFDETDKDTYRNIIVYDENGIYRKVWEE